MVDARTIAPVVEVLGVALAALWVWRYGWREYAVVALAGLYAEESSMLLYEYYGYGDVWTLMLHRTPVAVAAIWPLVVLSSLAVVRRAAARSRVATALATGALVVYDTLVMEPVATAAGLWSWRAGSYFGVPVLGVLGWGIFAAFAAAAVSWRLPIRAVDLLWRPAAIAALTQAVLAPAAVPSIAWDVRIPLSDDAYAGIVAAVALLLVPAALRLRSRLRLTLSDIAFKVTGAAIFFALIYGYWLVPFVGFCSLVPLPYLVLTVGVRTALRNSEVARA